MQGKLFDILATAISVLSILPASFCSSVASENAPLWNLSKRLSRAPSNNSVSLSSWHGIPSLQGFDNFNGVSNFDGSKNRQVVVFQEKQVVCKSQRVKIIQQQLQICEVETQTIVLSRFHDGVQVKNSKKDLARKSNRAVGYDANIASHLIHLVNSDGSLNSGSLGFQGTDVGNATIVPTGSNWDNVTFPASVQAAEQAAQAALNATKA
ncbi:hypothetical protein K443DRAFT_127023 [Laccaria amethystina LaAM-08-1]|uniref:Unplaced genomic scaffold K443scaffold_1, whole genome shotgun sequence n=1 Tax=Laccaria amethystina LaAM-08-1 TaxID=1095629 RepID=A0A0C9XZ86_9AGAR|nr:hypothetical protein K443DRAFT_127023 [Laccaria amethystina LaAM-08-1]